jgi:hypothetical protein
MQSMVQTQTLNNISFMLKDRAAESIASPFTAVNARPPPPSPPRLHGMNGMASDPSHLRPYSQPHTEHPQDQKPLPSQEHWQPPPRPQENGHYSASPTLDERDRSPHSPPKRKRSSSAEDGHSYHSVNSAPEQSRRRIGSYPSPEGSPSTVEAMTMEQQQQRTLPPMKHSEHERPWSSRDPHDAGTSNSHYREDGGSSRGNGSMDPEHPSHMESSSTTEVVTRAGVVVDTKKRKRVSDACPLTLDAV